MSEQCDGDAEPVPLNNTNSEDSDEEDAQDELAASLNQLTILERLGPSSDEMTEGEVESAFTQLTVAFRCDQFTLNQRLQAEEHARNKVEDNLRQELQRGREAVEALKALCLDSKRYRILEKLEFTLEVLGGTVQQLARTAEVLGAAHQEARVSRAVELMVTHVDNLRQRHDRHCAELEESRKLIGSTISCEQSLPDLREDIEMRVRAQREIGKSALRRRISASVITKESLNQELKRSADPQCLAEVLCEERDVRLPEIVPKVDEPEVLKEDKMEDVSSPSVEDRQPVCPQEGDVETVLPQPPSDPSASAFQGLSSLSCRHDHDEVKAPMSNRQPHPRALRRRQRSKADLDGSLSKGRKEGQRTSIQNESDTSDSIPLFHMLGGDQHQVHWMYHCRWILTCVYLTVLVAILLLAIFFWFVRTPVLWM